MRLEDAHRQNPKYMNEAAALLAAQWPKYGVDVRKRSLMAYLKERAAAATPTSGLLRIWRKLSKPSCVAAGAAT